MQSYVVLSNVWDSNYFKQGTVYTVSHYTLNNDYSHGVKFAAPGFLILEYQLDFTVYVLCIGKHSSLSHGINIRGHVVHGHDY